MENNVLFKEEQKFSQWWLWCLLLAPFIFSLLTIIIAIYEQFSSGTKNLSLSLIIKNDTAIALLILVAVIIIFLVLRLKTIITTKAIKIQYFPFFTKIIDWSTVETARVVTYGFVGYGIRISLKHGMVYNVKGNKGLALTLKKGKRLLIGTQKEKELEQIIAEIKT
ncbi:hypothetical protein KO500_15750 [Cellulophaga baltica]|uniref:hypothetical protein n=1 Tax=Cellulophaga TaxID=104264 RepID=UPI001C0678FA|nr:MULTISPECIES: hypothetical protein [Cellulophaga]MBU2997896.1 hypothetical protein [Cellulophaga baltica]MDO6769297.1 hypothetical protein [Cellulophaga sp. 1_MG-2023]